MQIRANFKQTTIKNVLAVLQFEVLQSAENFSDVIKLSGKAVVLDIDDEQPELPLDVDVEEPEDVEPFAFNEETGEIMDDEYVEELPESELPQLESGDE